MVRTGHLVVAAGLVLAIATAKEQPKCVFVTGGSGYIGRNVIRSYVADGIPVHAAVRSNSAWEVVKKLGAKPFSAQLDDEDALHAAAKGCDVAIHAAGDTRFFGDLEESRRVNVKGTESVMAAARRAGVRRAVYVGSDAAIFRYEGTDIHLISELSPLPRKPFPGIYSTSKNEAERAAFAAQTDEFEVIAVRLTLVWGEDDTVFLPRLQAKQKASRWIWYSGGDYLMATCHVLNAVEGIRLATTAEQAVPGEAYFLTDGKSQVMFEFEKKLLATVGVTDQNTPFYLANMPYNFAWIWASISEWWCGTNPDCEPSITRQELIMYGQEVTVLDKKARDHLGYVGSIKVKDGIAKLQKEHKEKQRTEQKQRKKSSKKTDL